MKEALAGLGIGAVLCAIVYFFVNVARVRELRDENDDLKLRLASASARIDLPPPAASVTPPSDPHADAARAAVIRCELGGGFPVRGQTWRVLCLKPSCVEGTSLYKVEP